MTFALSGSTITQSGADANLSGLSGISGVTTQTSGSVKSYYLGTLVLNVSGTLSIDPAVECLFSNQGTKAFEVLNGGVLNFGKATVVNGATIYSDGVGYFNTAASGVWWQTGNGDQGAFHVQSGGKLVWRGGTMMMPLSGFGFLAGSNIDIINAVVVSSRSVPSADTGRGLINSFSFSTGSVNGFKMTDGELLMSPASSVLTTGVVRQNSIFGINPVGSTAITLKDISVGGNGNVIDVPLSADAGFPNNTIIGSSTGTNLIILGEEASTNLSHNQGYCSIQKLVSVTVKTGAGAAITGAQAWIRDTNNGVRKNLNSIDDTADKTYVATTAASGATPAVQVVTGIVNVAGTSNGRGTANTGIYSVDLRGKTNVLGDDLFDVNAIAYGYLQQTQRVALKGVGTLVTAFALVADASVGSITESQAGALTTIWTLDQLYAAAKYWKTRAVLAQLEYPTSTTLPVTASGTVLNLGALNLVIDANASAAFALNTATATITIKASALAAGTLFQTFSTTGSMTLANGAAAQVIYTSAAGKNAVLQLTGVPSGAFVYVATNGGAPFAFTAGGGTYTAYLPVGATGTWSWKVALYGSLAASGTFTPAGNTSSAAIALAADPGITQATAATVAAYTALSSPDQLYDYAAYYETTAAGIASARKVAKTGTSADLGAQSLTIDANASSLFAVSGTALTIKAATFAAGSTMSALTTTGAVTPANGAAITCVYTSSAGTAGILNLTGLQAGSAVYVTKADGTQAAYTAATAGTTYTLYIPPGAAATWTWKAAKYGYLEASAAFASTGAQSAAVTQLVDPGITQASAATVAAYTTIANLDALYDYSAYWATTNAGIAVPRVVAKAGSTADLGTRALTLDATASVVWSVTSGAVTINAGTLAAGVTFLTLSAPAAALGLAHGAAIAAVYTDSAGRHVTVTAAGLIAGTRVQLWNSTDAVEVDNSVVGGSGGYVFPLIYTADKVYRLRATYASGATAMLPLQSSGTFGASGLAFAVSQAADAVYNANAVDGSTATEFAADFPHIQVDVSSSGGTTTVQRLYAWLVYEQTQADGIRNFYGCVAASDTANYVIDQSVVALQLDNVLSTPVRVTGGYLTRKDASTIIAPSSGSIQMDPGKAYVAAGGSTPGAITVPAGARVILMGSTGKYLAKGS